MTPQEYEKIVHDIAAALYELAESFKAEDLRYGTDNKWIGISGFQHQIDVSIAGKLDVILIECKNWNSRVDVPTFLTFLARILDIRPTENRRTIHPIVVTTVGFENGVRLLADYYKIDLQVVRSANEFAMKYKGHGYIGVCEVFTAKESWKVEKYDEKGNLIEVVPSDPAA